MNDVPVKVRFDWQVPLEDSDPVGAVVLLRRGADVEAELAHGVDARLLTYPTTR